MHEKDNLFNTDEPGNSHRSVSVQGSRAGKDFLYIGDRSDDTLKRFDAETGQFRDTFVTSESDGLKGPRGLLFGQDGNVLVSNQNVNLDQNGNVLKYKGQNGEFHSELVRSDVEGAPFFIVSMDILGTPLISIH